MKFNTILIIVLGIIVLVGLFVLLKPKSTPTPENVEKNTQNTNSTTTITPTLTTKTFEIKVEKGKIVSGSSTLKANEGDEILLKITSDVAEELHVHAYDKSIDLEPGQQVELSFTANLTGRFPFELEESKIELGVIEIQPKQ